MKNATQETLLAATTQRPKDTSPGPYGPRA